MTYLRRLIESVSEKISSGRLGQPVLARLSLIISPDQGHILPAAGEAVATVGEMLSLAARSLFAAGSVESGHLVAQLNFEGGRGALVVVTVLRDELNRVDLLLIGNHGTLRHENDGNTLTQQMSPLLHQRLGSTSRPHTTARGDCSLKSPRMGGVPRWLCEHPCQAEGYAEQFAADPRCRLVGVTDEDNVTSSRALWNAELAKRLGVPLIGDLDSCLRRPDVGVASVCVEFERRARVGAQCAAAGKHVYLDKPLATTNQEAEQLVSAIRQAGVRSQMFSMLRMPWVRRAKEIVSSGQIGDLLGLHCDLLFAKGRAGSADLSRPREEAYPPRRFTFIDSKRELFTTGVYSIGLMRWLSGRNVRRVYAQTSNYFFEQHQANNVEDFSAATLEFEGGLVGTITGGRIGWLSHPIFGPARVLLIGTGGSWMIDASEPRLEISCDRTQWRPGPPHPEDPMGFWSSTAEVMGGVDKFNWRALKSLDLASDPSFFIDCLEQDRESDMSAGDGMEILKVLLTAYESAASRKPIEVSG